MTTVHVIGAGLAGLACAVRCATAGRKIALYEAAGHAGGRCRSFSDESLGTLVEDSYMEVAMTGRVPTRAGNRDAAIAPHNVYQCLGDNEWISLAVATDEEDDDGLLRQQEVAHALAGDA